MHISRHIHSTLNNIWQLVQFMKLYTMQFSPISYYFQSKESNNSSAPKLLPNPVYPHCHRSSVTPASIEILHKQTHIYISTVMFSENKNDNKTLWSCSDLHSILITSQFLDSAIFIPECHSKILQIPHPSKTSNNVSDRSFFKV